MEKVQSTLKAINKRLTVEDFGSKRRPGNKSLLPQANEDHQKSVQETQNKIELAIKNFYDGQKSVFNSIVGDILLRVTVDYPFAPVSDTEESNSNKSRGFFVDAPGGTGKMFVMRTVQSFLELRGRKVISVATSGVAASLLQGNRTAHSEFEIPIPCYSESVCNMSMQSALAAVIREADLIIC